VNLQDYGPYLHFFFFSSRRRHTRSTRDWSSDVCSSDLEPLGRHNVHLLRANPRRVRWAGARAVRSDHYLAGGRRRGPEAPPPSRSEERRVGKEWSSRGAPEHEKERQKQMRGDEYGAY